MILHIIVNDKFTRGYIDFMLNNMKQWEHRFVVVGQPGIIEGSDRIVNIPSYKFICRYRIKRLIEEAEKVVVSWAYSAYVLYFLLNKTVWNKVYFQFWGGDFYDVYRERKGCIQEIKKHYNKKAYLRAKGLIFLVEGEQRYFKQMTGIENDFFVAPMPADGQMDSILEKFWDNNSEKSEGKLKVVVGNSATETNCHKEILQKLSECEFELEVFCPLSYGNMEYRDEVIDFGYKVLGEQFIPLTDYMTMDEYFEVLAKCDVGVFNNDRQQGLGNIYALLYLGKKVFIRQDTSMWRALYDQGYKVFDIKEINVKMIREFGYLSENDKINNHIISRKRIRNEELEQSWNKVFESNTG